MTRTELLDLVTALRDDRGRSFDAAAYDVLSEAVWSLQHEPATTPARDDLRRRVTALRDDRARTNDAMLRKVMSLVVAAFGGEDPPPTDPMVGHCAICGGAADRCQCRALPAYVNCPKCSRRIRAGRAVCTLCGHRFHDPSCQCQACRPLLVSSHRSAPSSPASGGCTFCGDDGSRCPVCQPD